MLIRVLCGKVKIFVITSEAMGKDHRYSYEYSDLCNNTMKDK